MRRECRASAHAHLFDCQQCLDRLEFELDLIAVLRETFPALPEPPVNSITSAARPGWVIRLPEYGLSSRPSPKKSESEFLTMCQDAQNTARQWHREDLAALLSYDEIAHRRVDNHVRPILREATLRISDPSIGGERRQDERFPAHSCVAVRNLKQSSGWQSGTLRDISLRGMLINTSEQPTLNGAFDVRIQNAIFPGEAVHVRVEGRAWLVGIRLKDTLTEKELRNVTRPFNC